MPQGASESSQSWQTCSPQYRDWGGQDSTCGATHSLCGIGTEPCDLGSLQAVPGQACYTRHEPLEDLNSRPRMCQELRGTTYLHSTTKESLRVLVQPRERKEARKMIPVS